MLKRVLKKITKKKIFISICVIIVATAITMALFGKYGDGANGPGKDLAESEDACYSAVSDGMSEDMGAQEAADEAVSGGAASDEAAAGESASGTTDISSAEQKMITTWYFSVESADYESSISKISQTVQALKGYIEYENESNANGELRSASYIIRIPDTGEKDWLEKVERLGTIISKSKSVENVTLQYIDTESRLKSLKTERKALMSLLESAKKVEDIIKVQSHLEDVNYQIESYESQIRSMQNDIDYMTVNLDVTEVNREAAQSPGIMDEIKIRFANSADGITGFVRSLFVGILGYSLYIILLAAAAVIIWRVYRKRKNRDEQSRNDSDN